ncbi:MAG: helix-turn-helix transcriptional regulator [Chitinophagaceae bacterium]|nr:helix-turn-helix transcriptional regulator [Chitinophagaceae bacterium]
MTFYENELVRIKSICYSNQGQIDTVIGTRNYIDNNFENDLNLDLLSYIRFTSKYHLLRLFKRYYGLTPRQYLIDKRITKSKEFLIQGMTITETCFAVGFKSPGSFSTLFKDKIGLTPTEFQKKQLSISEMNSDFRTCDK